MKNTTLILRLLSLVTALVLVASVALVMTSCGKAATSVDSSLPAGSISVESQKQGDRATRFSFFVSGADGKTEEYVISTDKTTLGEALLEAGIITEEEQKTGFINTVNGVTLNWDTDKAYWALYVGDDYAEKGVNETEVTNGGVYSFIYTKG